MHYVVTGSIGVGKSTVMQLLKKELNGSDVEFYDVDAFIAGLYEDPIILKELTKQLGTCNKRELSSMFFKSNNAKEKIEAIFNPRVLEFLTKIRNSSKTTVTEYPVVFEYSQTQLFDAVIVIAADYETRISRVIARNGHTRQRVLEIMANQINQDYKVKHSNFVIWNNASIDELAYSIQALANQIKQNV